MSNVVTIRINMPQREWEELRNSEPHSGRCNYENTSDRYDWFKAISVDISGSAFPRGHIFTSVAIRKRSYCGSFSTSKPALKLHFSKYNSSNKNAIEDLIGTQYITLNNCVQDPSYIRQPLGYLLFKQVGLPYSRCNFARVYINNTYYGVYLNTEPIKKYYLQNNFNGNGKGNLYKINRGEDFLRSIMAADRASFKGFSDYSDKSDLKLAIMEISDKGLAGMARVIDIDQFIRFFAMEALLKHCDGYTVNLSNAFIYNDVVAIAIPTVANIKFKFIPWDLDRILDKNIKFKLSDNSIPGRLVLNDANSLAKLKTEIRNYVNTVFNRDNFNKVLSPYIDLMQNILTSAGITELAPEIEIVREQLKLVKSGGFQLIGECPSDSVFLLDRATGDCIHANNAEFVGTAERYQEVYHYAPTTSAVDMWHISPSDQLGTYKIKNREYGTYLYCSTTKYAPDGNLNVYSFRYDQNGGNNFYIEPVECTDQRKVSGYFRLRSARTSRYVYFSEVDSSPGGRKKVSQIADPSKAAVLYLF